MTDVDAEAPLPPLPTYTSWDSLLQLIDSRLVDSHIALNPSTEYFMELLSGPDAQEHNHDDLLEVARNTIVQSDDVLQQTLRLILIQSPQHEEQLRETAMTGGTHYYIRSVSLSYDEVYAVLNRYT